MRLTTAKTQPTDSKKILKVSDGFDHKVGEPYGRIDHLTGLSGRVS